MRSTRVTVLTGFLGAGKTTLLNHILRSRPNEKIAVIVNEFGEIGIDGQLTEAEAETVVELNNGCVCCTVRGDLIQALRRLADSGCEFDRVIVETSGLADPAPVIQSFILDEVLHEKYPLDAIVTVVDAAHMALQGEYEEAREQIAFGDVILLNKVDLASVEKWPDLERRIRSLNPLAHIVHTRECALDLDDILDIGAFDLKNALRLDAKLLEGEAHVHSEDIGAVAMQLSGALDRNAFDKWLALVTQTLGRDLLRMKGIVHLYGEARRYVFHGVHMTVDGRPGKPWRLEENRLNQLVFIGRRLDASRLESGFLSCFVATG